MSVGTGPATDRPIGKIIRRKRRLLGWSIQKLAIKYLINVVKIDQITGDADSDEHPLALNEKDIGRLERGEPVKVTVAKLRMLCYTLQFSPEETARILAQAQNSAYIDLQEHMVRVMETLSVAAFMLLENPLAKQTISGRLGNRTSDDLSQREILQIVQEAIGDVLMRARAPTTPRPEGSQQADTPFGDMRLDRTNDQGELPKPGAPGAAETQIDAEAKQSGEVPIPASTTQARAAPKARSQKRGRKPEP